MLVIVTGCMGLGNLKYPWVKCGEWIFTCHQPHFVWQPFLYYWNSACTAPYSADPMRNISNPFVLFNWMETWKKIPKTHKKPSFPHCQRAQYWAASCACQGWTPHALHISRQQMSPECATWHSCSVLSNPPGTAFSRQLLSHTEQSAYLQNEVKLVWHLLQETFIIKTWQKKKTGLVPELMASLPLQVNFYTGRNLHLRADFSCILN